MLLGLADLALPHAIRASGYPMRCVSTRASGVSSADAHFPGRKIFFFFFALVDWQNRRMRKARHRLCTNQQSTLRFCSSSFFCRATYIYLGFGIERRDTQPMANVTHILKLD